MSKTIVKFILRVLYSGEILLHETMLNNINNLTRGGVTPCRDSGGLPRVLMEV